VRAAGGGETRYGWVSPRPKSPQDAANRRIYSSPRLVLAYARKNLTQAETTFMERYARELANARVLELGCGAGRITRHLIDTSHSVVGIDVSPAMIEYCRRRLRRGTFVVGDLRDLSSHADASFEVVVAGANLLDAVAHEERIDALTDVHRVLTPEGLLYFSSHNRSSVRALAEARRGPQLHFAKNPYRQARAAMSYVQGRRNHPRLARLQKFEGEYALLNDEAHGWGLLHYYIDRVTQTRQLADARFELLETIAPDGSALAADADDTRFTELHYVARAR
jgi:SAM-dependent methyltransferase